MEYYSKFITEEEKDKLDVWLENKKDQIDTELGEEILHELIPKLEPGEQNDVLTWAAQFNRELKWEYFIRKSHCYSVIEWLAHMQKTFQDIVITMVELNWL